MCPFATHCLKTVPFLDPHSFQCGLTNGLKRYEFEQGADGCRLPNLPGRPEMCCTFCTTETCVCAYHLRHFTAKASQLTNQMCSKIV